MKLYLSLVLSLVVLAGCGQFSQKEERILNQEKEEYNSQAVPEYQNSHQQ